MKRIVQSLLGLTMALLLPSCLEFDTKITLNKDGSGTITEELVFGPQMAGMINLAAAQGGENPLTKMKDKEAAIKKASSFGKGVTFLKSEDIKTKDGGVGVRLVYQFEDINDVTMNPSGDLSTLSDLQDGGDVMKNGPDTMATFRYNEGRLVISLPQPDENQSESSDTEAVDTPAEAEEMAQMAAQMMKGMKMSAHIEIPTGISKTTATHHQDNTITLFEMDMDEVMKNKGGLAALSKLEGKKPEELAEALKDLKGVKGETQKEVVVILE